MADVEPLVLRFVRQEWSTEVPSPPHDAMTPAARRDHLRRHPRSYLGVTRAPDDVDPESGATDQDVLAAGRESLEAMLAVDVFGPASNRTYFVYRLEQDGHSQTGLVCGVATSDYDTGTIRIHERINTSRAQHLANHLRVVGAQSSPIALAVRDRPEVGAALDATVVSTPPFLEIDDDDGLCQQLWEIVDPETVALISDALADSPLYLIDGHHRAAAASTDRERAVAEDGEAGDRHLMLSTIFPYEQLQNQAFHRSLTGIDPSSLLADLAAAYPVRETAEVADVVGRRASELAVAVAAEPGAEDRRPRWLLIDVPFAAGSGTSLETIDPVRLAHNILVPILGIDESGSDPRLSYQPGMADADAVSAIDPDDDQAVFLMRPVPMSVLMEASDQGLVMPPKSTYFMPKVRSGVFIRLIDGP